MSKTNTERFREVQRLRMLYQDLQQEARSLVAKYDGNPPGQLDPHYPDWLAVNREAKAVRNQINLLVFPHEWYLK